MKLMNLIAQFFFPFQKFEIETTLSDEKLVARLQDAIESKSDYYDGRVDKTGFCISEKPVKNFMRNSLAPVAEGSWQKKENVTVVSGIIRMNFVIGALFATVQVVCIIFMLMDFMVAAFPKTQTIFIDANGENLWSKIILFLVLQIFLNFAFRFPAKRLYNRLVIFLCA